MMSTLQNLLGRKETKIEASDLEKLAHREIDIEKLRLAVSADIAIAERVVANKLISTDDVAAETEKLRDLQSRARDLVAAIAAIRGRRLEAIKDTYLARAGELRAIAREKNHELTTLEAQTGKLLAELGELESIPFTPHILAFEPKDHTCCYTPKSVRLRGEVSKLLSEADALEKKTVTGDGTVDVDNQVDAEGLRLAVLLHASISPSLEAIDGWLIDCMAGRGVELGEKPRRYALHWRGGSIDRNASFVFCPKLSPPKKDGPRDGTGFNTAAGTFTAANRGSRT